MFEAACRQLCLAVRSLTTTDNEKSDIQVVHRSQVIQVAAKAER